MDAAGASALIPSLSTHSEVVERVGEGELTLLLGTCLL
jgi:hypothetical protein